MKRGKNHNGYLDASGNSVPSLTRTRVTKLTLAMKYDPKFDPTVEDPLAIPEEVRLGLHAEDILWNATKHLEGFQEALVTYWQACLELSRRMIKVFALALDLPEEYFDDLVTFPGADMSIGLYPGWPEDRPKNEMGLNAHTDIQVFTLLWQDHHGGLELLNRESEWVKAKPIEDTLVINIGDFLMRLTNDRFKSTVHQVVQHGKEDRMSVAFFFGEYSLAIFKCN